MHDSFNAKQFQCVRCLAEQPAEDVIEFSAGRLGCVYCAQFTWAMTYDDYYKILAETRRKFGVDVNWRPS